MTTQDRALWEQRHAAEAGEIEPSPFLVEIFEQGAWAIRSGKALDLACGKGRNALYLAKRGFAVDAVDIAATALGEGRRRAQERGLSVDFREVDLDQWEPPDDQYDLILNIHFLDRSWVPKIKRSLKLGGHVIFETFLIDQRVLGHPKNPAHLLDHNELLRLFADFRVLLYREGKFVERDGEAYKAALLAQKLS
jgi:2-polyprenyl-3-methyl-5-hydroxy-6-metoxy-1,4-benzoquinol methylase